MQDSNASVTGADHRTQWLSTFSLRLTGYVLLALSAFDVIATIIPPDFFNPEWEFRAIGKLVEQVPVPLIGLSLVFYGGLRYRRRLEKLFLRPLALLAVLAGVGYLLLIPLGLSNSVRLHNANQTQQSQQLELQLARFKQLEQRISTVPPEQVLTLVTQFNLPVPKEGTQDPAKLKQTVLSQLEQNQAALRSQALNSRKTQAQQHLKNSVKWILGALLSGVCLIYLGMGANKYFLLGLN